MDIASSFATCCTEEQKRPNNKQSIGDQCMYVQYTYYVYASIRIIHASGRQYSTHIFVKMTKMNAILQYKGYQMLYYIICMCIYLHAKKIDAILQYKGYQILYFIIYMCIYTYIYIYIVLPMPIAC